MAKLICVRYKKNCTLPKFKEYFALVHECQLWLVFAHWQ